MHPARPQGAPHVTPQCDRPLIPISLRTERGVLDFVLKCIPQLNVESSHKRRFEMFFCFFYFTLHSINSKQKGLDS